MQIASIFTVFLLWLPQAQIQTHPDDPLHRFAILQVNESEVTVEVKADHEGSFHIWACSDEFDPLLSVVHGDKGNRQTDNHSGGGTTAFIGIHVSPGAVARCTVSRPTLGKKGCVELHWVATIETAATRSLAREVRADLKEAEMLAANGNHESGREMLALALEKLREVEGSRLSHEIGQAAWKLAYSTRKLNAIRTSLEAWMMAHEHLTRIFPAEHPNLLSAKLNLGGTLHGLGDLARARDLFEALVEIQSRILPEDDPRLLRAKNNLASTKNGMGDLPGARTLFEEVLEAQSRVMPKEDPDRLSTMANLAVTVQSMGDLKSARTIFEELLEIRTRIHAADHPARLNVMRKLMSTLYELGDFDKAFPLAEEVYETSSRILPRDHPDLLHAQQGLALIVLDQGKIGRAYALAKGVLEGRKRTLPEDHWDVLVAKENFALVLLKMGDCSTARGLLETVVRERTALLPDEHPNLLGARQNLASLLHRMGDLQGARTIQETVLDIQSRTLPEDHPNLLRSKGNLASTLFELGDLPGARILTEEVLRIREQLLPPHHPEVCTAKNNLAGILEAMGEVKSARTLLEKMVGDRSLVLPPDHPELIHAKGNLAYLMKAMDDLEGACALFEEVHERSAKILPPDNINLLRARGNLAITLHAQGDLQRARVYLEDVEATFDRNLPADHPDLHWAKVNLAFLYHRMGIIDEACERACEIAGYLLSRCSWASLCLSPREAREIVAVERYRHAQVRFLTAGDDSASTRRLRFDLAETFRCVAGLDLGSLATPDDEIMQLRARSIEIRKKIGDLLGAGSTGTSMKRSLVELVRERDKVARTLRSKLVQSEAFVDTIRSADIAAGMPEGTACIGFVQTNAWHKQEDSGRIVPREAVLAVHLLTHDGAIFEKELGPAKELEALAAQWRASLGEPIERNATSEPATAMDERKAGVALRERLLDPVLAGLGEQTDTLLICADGFVHTLPLDALPLEKGRLGDCFQVVNQTSFRCLVAPRPPLDPTSEARLLAAGGIDFYAEPEAAQKRQSREIPSEAAGTSDDSETSQITFRNLFQTLMETKVLGKLFQKTFAKEGTIIKGGTATKSSFSRLAPGHRYLHLATHGWFAPIKFAKSMNDGTALVKFDGPELVTRLSPMSLCGLAFAGANHGRDAYGRVPGILTAEELTGLDLSACDLAVLSACETNVGIRSAGVGIQSLKAALHAAGVRTAITSLWKVDDKASRKLMECFYTFLWADKIPKAESLWKAKQVLRDQGHPMSDWAAWILSGDPE